MLNEIIKGTDSILPGVEALEERLELAAKEGRPLRVKLGIDPSATDIHLGHTVPLWKMRRFQDLGHQAVLIIGDYTAMVGDPSGRNAVRPQLTHDEVLANAKSYQNQIRRIVDLDKAEVRYNGDWFKGFEFGDVIRLASTTTLMRMLERKDFKERVEQQRPLYLHELLYPLMQAWDSVEIEADIELGATDQVFNILRGRDLMAERGMMPQLGVILPLLIGLDGEKKMGKSLGNYIGLHDAPKDMYGKVMSLPDNLIVHYEALAIPTSAAEVEQVRIALAEGSLSPMDAKLDLAHRITAQYHDNDAADQAADHFQRVVRDKGAPKDVPPLKVAAADLPITMLDLVHSTGSLGSKGEARRVIQQGGVRLDDQVVKDVYGEVSPRSGTLLRVGKRRYYSIQLAD